MADERSGGEVGDQTTYEVVVTESMPCGQGLSKTPSISGAEGDGDTEPVPGTSGITNPRKRKLTIESESDSDDDDRTGHKRDRHEVTDDDSSECEECEMILDIIYMIMKIESDI